MRVVHINSVPYGSTCRVMLGITETAREKGIACDTAAGYSTHPVEELPREHYRIGGLPGKWLHMMLARLTGLNGCFSVLATLRLLRHIQRGKYDLVHLHNMHGWYVNLPLLFRFLCKKRLPIVWTLHDCWAFTGQCAHYTAIDCNKWQNRCHHCTQRQLYPQSLMDVTRMMHKLKERWFASLPDVCLVTPSHWLAGQLGHSFLSRLPVSVIPNGVDRSVFKPTPGWKKNSRFMVLGAASGWTERKGLNVFVSLAQRLGEAYQIVMVGTDERIDRMLPPSITSIHRTQNASVLAQLYTAADVFVNPSCEENFPTVHLEALACGTPVAAFDAGGNAEALDDACGIVVPAGDVEALEKAIRRICMQKPFSAQQCLRRAEAFDQSSTYEAYIRLYRQKERKKP